MDRPMKVFMKYEIICTMLTFLENIHHGRITKQLIGQNGPTSWAN